MLKILMIGMILLLTFSCRTVTIKKPMKMYVVSTKFYEVGAGLKNLNVRSDYRTVGNWVSEIEHFPLEQAPQDMMCVDLKDWTEIIRPTLIQGARLYGRKR